MRKRSGARVAQGGRGLPGTRTYTTMFEAPLVVTTRQIPLAQRPQIKPDMIKACLELEAGRLLLGVFC